MTKRLWAWLALAYAMLSVPLSAQVLTFSPALPKTDDSVEIIFDATKGNGGLANFTGDVYAHTGVITNQSKNDGDWKYVAAPWGSTSPKVKMESLGNNLYRLRMNIRNYYGVPQGEDVYKLAFVFRNANGSQSGRSSTGGDIFYNINLYALSNYVSHTFQNDSLLIQADSGKVLILPYSDRTFRVRVFPQNILTKDSSLSITAQPSTAPFSLLVDSISLKLVTAAATFYIRKSPLRMALIQAGDTIWRDEIGYYSQAGRAQGVRTRLQPNEALYGTGSRAIPHNRRGKRLQVYNNAAFGYSYGAEQLNICIPMVLSSGGYGILFDNARPGVLDLGSTTSDVLEYTAESGEISYYIMSGDFKQVLREYGALTGYQPLPPRWALGYIQSKYGYETESEARSVVNTLRQQNFPLDALVLDLYWFGSPATMGNLDWDYSKWQKPKKMMRDFDSVGVKTILIAETYFTQNSTNFSTVSGNGYLAKTSNGSPFIIGGFWAGSSGLLDVTNPAALEWMWTKYRDRTNEGVGGWWNDLGEPESHPAEMLHQGGTAREIHNNYSLLWAQMLHRKFEQEYPNTRLFNLIRSGYTGMQRYSTFPWSGDIQRSFDGLRAQIPLMLGAGMSGQGYMHSDVGGFVGGGLDSELYTRWVQFGVFAPVLRIHGTGIPTEPTAHPDPYKGIVRDFIKLRYSLLPYNYSLAWENHTEGTPLARPMNFHAGDTTTAGMDTQYFWGENLLVAPILQQGQTQRGVDFPSDTWIDFWNSKQSYAAHSTHSIAAPIQRIPIFVRSGSFLPLATAMRSTREYSTDTLTVRYYPDASAPTSEYRLYDDDGATPNAYAKNSYHLLHFAGTVAPDSTEIKLDRTGGGFTGAPIHRELYFEVQRITASPLGGVKYNGISIAKHASMAAFRAATEGWFWDAAAQVLHIHVRWTNATGSIVISQKPTSINDVALQPAALVVGEAFPNPTADVIAIPLTANEATRCEITVFSADGRSVYAQTTSIRAGETHTEYLPLNQVGAGLYFVRVTTQGEIAATLKVTVAP